MTLRTGLLLGASTKRLESILKQCFQNETLGTLYVNLVTGIENNQPSNITSFNAQIFRRTVIDCYRSSQFVNLDIRILLTNGRDPGRLEVRTSRPIEIVYFDSTLSLSTAENYIHQNVINKTGICRTVPCHFVDVKNDNDSQNEELKYYDSVVLGGTFDKLHVGHKILFTEAILRCRKSLTVGVMCDRMLQSKTLSDLIDDCDIRIKHVEQFLNDVDPTLTYNVVEINDVYGPTKTDPTFEMIVVSRETRIGAEKINQCRRTNGLNQLDVVEIDVLVCNKESDYEEPKISSSNFRMRLLGTLIREPTVRWHKKLFSMNFTSCLLIFNLSISQLRPNLPPKPYIIGLTGGVGSGKSAVAQYLVELGCGCINCDELGHKIYSIDSPGYKFVERTFGSRILNEDGSVNRKLLGSMVFNNPELLQKLNEGLWPLIFDEVKKTIDILHQNKNVVIIEAALLLQAHWNKQCHEVWTCIVPPDEAIRRLQIRNKFTVDEARSRLNAQPCNKDYVSEANVVFCTYWDPSYTRQQVYKAWNTLKERLPANHK